MTESPVEPATDPAAAQATGALRIGEWELVPALHTLQRGAVTHRLPKRLVRLLQVLAARPGGTHTREELLDAVWDRKFVNDEVLSRAIAELRGLLGDDVRAPSYIETLPKTGYRLIAEVRAIESTAAIGVADTADAAVPADVPVSPAARVVAPAARPNTGAGRWLVALVVLGLSAWMLRGTMGPDDVERVAAPAQATWNAERMLTEQPFLSGAEWERQPRFSRDGRWLLHIAQDLQTQHTELRYSAADGGAGRALDAGPGRLSGAVFSPDGTRVAVMAREEGGCVIRLIDLPSEAPRQIALCEPRAGTVLDWPQSDRLLFTAPPPTADQGAGLWALHPDTGALSQLTFPRAEDIADTQPRARADGTIAFLRGPYGQQRIWQWANGEASLLLDSADRIPDLAWTADGRHLLVASDRSGYPALHLVDIADRSIRLLGGRGAASLDRAADDTLVYEQRRYDANIWQYRADGTRRVLTRSTRYDAYPALSPDNTKMAYVSNRDGNGSVWLHDLGSDTEQRVDLPDALAWVRPRWLHARTLGATRYREDRGTELVAFDLTSGLLAREHPITGPGFAAMALGQSNYLLGREHEAALGMQLWLAGPDGQALVEGADAVGEFRTDGTWIAWQRRGSPGLWLRAYPDSGPAIHIDAPGDGRDYAAWTVASGWLVYADRDDSGWSLWRRQLPEGVAEPWLTLEGSPSDAQIAVASDLSFALVTHIDDFSADLLRVPAPPAVDQPRSSE